MRLLTVSILLLALARACPGPDAADLDAAGEAVVRHLVEQNFGAYETSPWEVVCLRVRDEFQDGAGLLRRFEGDGAPESAPFPPVVPADRCQAADEERGQRWLVNGTGEVGLLIELREAERAGEGRLRIEAGASGGPIDFSVYECMLERKEEGWVVQECHAFIMT